MYDIIVIGAGPSGMTAAIYATRAMKKVLVLESMSYGGQIVNTNCVENYPAEEKINGFDLATKMYEQAKNLGVEFKFEKVIDIIDDKEKEVITSKDKYKALAVIIATGNINRKLGLASEEELVGKGVSYCATCDGSFYKGKNVAVVGGGNTALDDALYLSDIANKVYLIHRRDSFRGDFKTVSKLKEKSNVEFILDSAVTKLNSSNTLQSIEVTDKNGNKKEISIEGLFIAIGRTPENEIFSKLVDLDENGYAISNEACTTKTRGIFVSGDNRKKELRQLVTAVSDGANAATSAIKYINSL